MAKVQFISVINGSESIRAAVARCASSTGFAVEVFASAEEFLKSRRLADTVCLIIDAHMPGMGGLQLQSHLASSGRSIPIIFITASLDEAARARALKVGAVDFLRKPSGEKALLREIRSTLRLKEPETETARLKEDDRP